MEGIGQFIPLILIFVIFYFFLIRPQQKKAKDHKQMTENNSGDWKFNEEKDRWMSKSAWEADAWARCMRK